MDTLTQSTGFTQSADLTELIDFLNDDWERREPDPVEELSEDLGAFLHEGGELTMPLSAILNSHRCLNSPRPLPSGPRPHYTLC